MNAKITSTAGTHEGTIKDDTMRRLAVILYGEKRLAELDALPEPYTTERAIKEDFECDAKQVAESHSKVDDPLVFDEIKENKAFFFDSKCVYYVDENLEFHYACAR